MKDAKISMQEFRDAKESLIGTEVVDASDHGGALAALNAPRKNYVFQCWDNFFCVCSEA